MQKKKCPKLPPGPPPAASLVRTALPPKATELAGKLKKMFEQRNKDNPPAELQKLKDKFCSDSTLWANHPMSKTLGLSFGQFLELLTKLGQDYKQEEALALARLPCVSAQHAQGIPMLMTPTEDGKAPGKRMPLHRTAIPQRSKLKSSGSRAVSMRISHDGSRSTIDIESCKAHLEQLWFVQPGQIVECDRCGNRTPQHGGSLQGASGRSQFAQNEFVCHSCQV
jgi:hypothetical protein